MATYRDIIAQPHCMNYDADFLILMRRHILRLISKPLDSQKTKKLKTKMLSFLCTNKSNYWQLLVIVIFLIPNTNTLEYLAKLTDFNKKPSLFILRTLETRESLIGSFCRNSNIGQLKDKKFSITFMIFVHFETLVFSGLFRLGLSFFADFSRFERIQFHRRVHRCWWRFNDRQGWIFWKNNIEGTC